MNGILEYVQPIGILGLVGICLYLVKMANGKLNNKVSRGACHDAQNAIRGKIDDLDSHMSERFDDLKDLVKKNGRKD